MMKNVAATKHHCRLHSVLLLAISYALLFQFTLMTNEVNRGLRSTNTEACAPRNGTTTVESKKIRWNHSIVRDHPHAGARDENVTWPYVPDVKALRRKVLQYIQEQSMEPNHYLPLEPTSSACKNPPGVGFEGPNGYKALREYVELDGPDPLPEEEAPVNEWKSSTRRGHLQRYKHGPPPVSRTEVNPPRILCGLKTHVGKHDKVADVADTWGWRCDGFFAASSKTDRDIGADLLHEGPEEYTNLWQKVRSMAAFMYDYYLDDYDYFLFADDDTFIIMENLRNYLLSLESATGGRNSRPLYIGSPFSLHEAQYNTGGPGYLLNRDALRRLVEDGLPYYFASDFGGEDVLMGTIMATLHIHMVDTSDAANRQRFFHDDLESVASDEEAGHNRFLSYKRGYRAGRNVMSTQSIGFHRIAYAKRFSAILYNACPQGTVLGDAQNSTVAPASLESI
jgi:hypothetical protein